MGWLDYHLWEFTTDARRYGILIPGDPDWNKQINNAASTKLSALLTTGVTEFGYVYDFGDDWKHRIVVEDIKPAEAGAPIPGAWAVNVDPRLRTAAAHILSSLKTSPANEAGKPTTLLNGTADLAIRTTSTSSRSRSLFAGSPTPIERDDRKPSRNNPA